VPSDRSICLFFWHGCWYVLIAPFWYYFYGLFVLFLDHPAGAINDPDRKSVNRARDIVSNAVISELINEDSQAQDAFTGSLRHQIVANCQHLRVHLLLVDRLMTLYNESASSAKAAEAPKIAT
jgi:hypothetical protein